MQPYSSLSEKVGVRPPTVIENWWAFFIVAGGLLFVSIAKLIQEKGNGRFPFLVRSNIGISLIIFTVAGMFLLNLDWDVWWPLMIITPGIALFYVGGSNPTATAVTSMSHWIAGSIVMLGSTFLLDQLGIINLARLFGDFRWWGLFILPTALGALLNAWKIRQSDTSSIAEPFLCMTGVLVGGTAVQELLGFDWSNNSSFIGIWLVISGIILLFSARRR